MQADPLIGSASSRAINPYTCCAFSPITVSGTPERIRGRDDFLSMTIAKVVDPNTSQGLTEEQVQNKDPPGLSFGA